MSSHAKGPARTRGERSSTFDSSEGVVYISRHEEFATGATPGFDARDILLDRLDDATVRQAVRE